jgi:cyclopropane fatty-acyl-phospholipid synthase-like methyltransferase
VAKIIQRDIGMKYDPNLSHWLNIKNEKEARVKIITDTNWDKRTKQDVERLSSNLGFVKTDTVLDFGCGIGRLCKVLAPHCANMIGVDVSDEMIKYAVKYCRDIEGLVFMPMPTDFLIPLEDNLVDKVFSLLVLQHIERPKAFKLLREFNRVLKMFGRVYLQYPSIANRDFFYNYIKQRLKLGIITPLIEFYTREELEMIFEECGFDILDIEHDQKDFYVLAEKVRDIQHGTRPMYVKPELKKN